PIIVRQHLLKSRGHQVKASRIPGGAQLFKNLLSTAAKRKIPIIYKSTALELLSNSRLEISGVRVLMEGGVKDYLVKGGVVLATGGFHANRDLVKDYIGGWSSKMPFRGSRANTGENIILTRPLKPKLVNMDQFHGGPIHGPTKANPSSMVNYGICVTPAGNRYVNEGWTYVRIGKETALKTSGNHAYIILDEESKKEPVVFERFERYAISKATIFEHEEISGLARISGINVEGLCKTVEKYNTAVLSERVTDLDPPNSLERPRLIKIPKFYAIPFRGGMTATFGGPLINVKAQVINQADKIIPGLYAVGNAAGGLFYGDYIVGSQIGAAIVFGRIAAADAYARAIKRDI
ncbi:MAG: FAD-binding protein, partial [Desulfobacteraceae bacterium]|nr:FAD-binding protein [Desulfobacteraceae bacterium]